MSDIEVRAEVRAEEQAPPVEAAEFVALSPYELETAHKAMEKWAEGKRAEMLALIDEGKEALAAAVAHKWRQGPFKRQIALAAQRYEFYLKIKRALALGYLVVPNFPMTIFAVRTDRKSLPSGITTTRWSPDDPPGVDAKLLPEGEGRFVSPRTQGDPWTDETNDEKGNAITYYKNRAIAFVDPSSDFPIALAKPQIIEATSKALSQKLFDQLGIADGNTDARRGDPIILGRLLNPRKLAPSVTFFLGWVTDMRRV